MTNVVTLPVIRIERNAQPDDDQFTIAARNLVDDYVDDHGPVPDSELLAEAIAAALQRAWKRKTIYG